jgi:hypothetical protein
MIRRHYQHQPIRVIGKGLQRMLHGRRRKDADVGRVLDYRAHHLAADALVHLHLDVRMLGQKAPDFRRQELGNG